MSDNTLPISIEEERRLRTLAHGLAKDIEDPDALLSRLGFTHENLEELGQTKLFKTMLAEAHEEWQGANNTRKRVKLKAAINIEEALPHMYTGMIDKNEPLSSRVKAFEIVARVAGLGGPEASEGYGGASFQLTIQLAGNKPVKVIDAELGAIPAYPEINSESDDEDFTSLPEDT